jgi:Ca2+-binding RTX toxin-like protein
MNGGGGNDTMLGQSGNDTMNGGENNDIMRGGGGNDTMAGNAGNDVMGGGPGNDTLNAGDGDDVVGGGQGSDTTNAGTGLDTYDTDNPGPDVFFVNAGDVPSAADETINCGGGRGLDRVLFSGSISQQQTPSNRVFLDGVTNGTYTVAQDCEQVFLNSARVLGANLAVVPAAFESFSVSSSVLTGDSIEFIAEGPGLIEMRLQIFTLTGRKLSEQTEKTNYLEFEGMTQSGIPLANGVYLYTLTAKGSDGKSIKSEVRKLIIQR